MYDIDPAINSSFITITMSKTHPRIETVLTVSGAIAETAAVAARAAAKQIRKATRAGRGLTIRPGEDTPLWNILAEELRGHVAKHGEQVKLARFIGLPRQRLNAFLVGKSALPDAERTLLLLQWLEAKKRGVDLG